MTLNEQYTQMMLTGIVEIIFGIAVLFLAGWFLWKRYVKNKAESKRDSLNPELDKDTEQ